MPLATRILTIPAVVIVLLAGLWFWSGVIAPGYYWSIGLGFAWFIAVSFIIGKLRKEFPELNWYLRGTFLACALAATFAFYWTSIRETEVNEDIATGVPASQLDGAQAAPTEDPLAPQTQESGEAEPTATPKADKKMNVVTHMGEVKPAGHSASGTARVIDLADGGRVLTLADDFEIDPGPQVRVWLVAGEGVEDYKDLGGLKGSKGNQQYKIPEDVDVAKYSRVVFWCVPFTTELATAQLQAA